MIALAWTEVGAALPDDDTLVLIALECGEVWPAERVTHWMHLPAAPGAAS